MVELNDGYVSKKRGVVKRKRCGERELSRREHVLRVIVDARRAQPCADCGGSFPTCAMDFDHRPGETKFMMVTSLVRQHHPISRVIEEMAKCDVVCANCHRIRTRQRLLERFDGTGSAD